MGKVPLWIWLMLILLWWLYIKFKELTVNYPRAWKYMKLYSLVFKSVWLFCFLFVLLDFFYHYPNAIKDCSSILCSILLILHKGVFYMAYNVLSSYYVSYFVPLISAISSFFGSVSNVSPAVDPTGVAAGLVSTSSTLDASASNLNSDVTTDLTSIDTTSGCSEVDCSFISNLRSSDVDSSASLVPNSSGSLSDVFSDCCNSLNNGDVILFLSFVSVVVLIGYAFSSF